MTGSVGGAVDMAPELIVRKGRLPDREGLWDVAMDNGRICAIARKVDATAPQEIVAEGRLVIPGLVDAHFHLDKALLLERTPSREGTLQEAIRITGEAKRGFTVEDIAGRARRALEMAIRHGTTAMRTHVEVDPIVGLKGMEAILPLQREYAWAIDLQICVFPQEGIFQAPGTERLMRQALAMGGQAVGGVPYNDSDPAAHIDLVFDLAREFDRDVDFHLDFADDPEHLHIAEVAEQTVRRGWQGRVCVGHETELGALEPEALGPIAARIRDAGISVLSLPATDLYLMGRRDRRNPRRGLAPVARLLQAGVNVAVATNNVQNAFTPFGDGDLLRIANLLANAAHLGSVEGLRTALRMATDNAARAIRLPDYGLVEGGRGDLVVLDCEDDSRAVAAIPERLYVIKGGRASVTNRLLTTFATPRV
jgi:cytosine deaminase